MMKSRLTNFSARQPTRRAVDIGTLRRYSLSGGKPPSVDDIVTLIAGGVVGDLAGEVIPHIEIERGFDFLDGGAYEAEVRRDGLRLTDAAGVVIAEFDPAGRGVSLRDVCRLIIARHDATPGYACAA